jgi:ATP-dependent exoDNAse (exonuclease V) beta subunit
MNIKVDPNKPLQIYNASAGSGKTYTLVQEYLRIILHSEDPYKFKSILAMTFTNKAANEMKERIITALIDLKTPNFLKTKDQLKFLKQTTENLKISPRIIEERSAKVLNKVLHHYSSFSVLTIDKFTHKIIRTFAKDLGISIDFDVELDVKSLRKNVTDLLFDNIGRNKELTHLMKRYAKDNLEQDKSWNFSRQVFEFSDLLFKEDALKSIEILKNVDAKVFNQAKEELKKEIAIFENKLKSQGDQAFAIIEQNNLKADDFKGKSRSVFGYFKKLKGGEDMKPSNTLIKYYESDEWANNHSPNKVTVESIQGVLAQYFKQILELFETDYLDYNLNKEIYKNINNLSLLKYVLKIIEDIKEEENILLISDFYKKISDLIIKEPIPFIYEHLGTRFEHFLLDEFQDTSRLQWINLVPLVHNTLASGNQNLIVGDGKQAIYRWRNGEVEQFTKLPDEIFNPDHIESLQEAEQTFKDLGQKIELDNNYRSAKEIVKFNNELFKHLANKLAPHLQYIYDDVKQTPIKKHQGYVQALFKDDFEDEEQLEFTLEAIHQSLENGFDYKDICIIVRNNKKGAMLANFLSEEGIDVISPDSLFIGKDTTVKFLFHLMNATIHLNDNNYKYKALEHYAILNGEEPTTYIQQAKDLDIKTYFLNQGVVLPDSNLFHNLYEFVEVLIQVFNFDPTYNSFLQFFLELVHQYETLNNSNVRDFLLWYKDKGAEKSIVSPEGANAVQIMTIHKSKGLQFPVVICPFLDWKFDITKQTVWVENENFMLPAFFVNMSSRIQNSVLNDVYSAEEGKFYLDQLNLLYVAFTRPETALFLCGKSKGNPSPVKDWLAPFFKQSELFSKTEYIYEYGALIKEDESEKSLKNSYPLTFLKQVMNKPQLSYKSALSWDVNDIDKKRNFGTLVHQVLSKLTTKNDLPITLDKFYSKGLIDDSQKTDILKYINELFNNLHFESYFNLNLKILNETEIINQKGFKLIPDKVLINKDDVLIVDFKTGQPAESHKKQVEEYIKLYKDMGFDNVKGELFYTEKQKVIQLFI